MKHFIFSSLMGLLICIPLCGDATGRGFGGFRGGGGWGGGGFQSRGGWGGGDRFGGGGWGGGGDRSGGGGWGGERSGGWGGSSERSGSWGDRSYSSSRSTSGYSGWRGSGMSSSYSHSGETARGGSYETEGTRGAGFGRYGGAAAGGTRSTDVTTAGGRTYSGSSEHGAAVGPYGRAVGGGEHSGTATGPNGSMSHSWQSAFAGRSFSGDMGLAHYSSFNAAGVAHSTTYWSHGAMTTQAGYVRNGFGYYSCFHPSWYTAHPGAWYAAGWNAGAAAWVPTTWVDLGNFCGYAASQPTDYNYGTDVVYNNNTVYVNGQDAGTAQQYAQQATTIAEQGQTANAPPTEQWKALGVFALTPADQKTSNNVFQLAVDQNGVIRGNYYDGLMDTTTPVYGSTDRKTQRAAWTIGKSKDRVFEAGIYNLTKPECPVLVHFGSDKTQQWLLVRVEQP